MISDKLKQDAATITSELKVIATKMPLVFHNYDYLNEKASVVLKRRKGQLGEIKSKQKLLLFFFLIGLLTTSKATFAYGKT